MPARILALLCAVASAYAVAAGAATYVSDQLSINLRTGPGNQYRIVRLLPAGARLEVLDEADGWSQVRTTGGDRGYVLTRFLSDQPAARDRLAGLRQRVATLEETNARLRDELSEALAGASELDESRTELTAENRRLEAELAAVREASGNAIRLHEENQRFRERILSLESEQERLRHENEALQSRRAGMKVGALILAAGIAIGMVAPLLRRRSRSSWDSL